LENQQKKRKEKKDYFSDLSGIFLSQGVWLFLATKDPKNKIAKKRINVYNERKITFNFRLNGH